MLAHETVLNVSGTNVFSGNIINKIIFYGLVKGECVLDHLPFKFYLSLF